jgi:replicative DNA helicase
LTCSRSNSSSKTGNDDSEDEETGVTPDVLLVNLLLAKQRNGPTGDVNLTFIRSVSRFENTAKITDDVVP